MSSKKQASSQMKFTQRELNRQQKLVNTANLARLVRTDSSLMAQPPVKKPRTVSIANGNVIPTKKIGPAALPTGFVPSKTSKLPIKVSESSTPVIVNMCNQAKPSTSFGLNSQNYSFVIQDSGIKPSPHKNIVVDQRTGKRLSAVSYEQLVGNFGKNVAIKIPASFSGQKFISMSDLVVQNVQPVLNNQAVQMSKQPGQVMHTVPQDQNFTGIEEIIENDSSATFNAQTQNGAVSGNDDSDNYTLSHDDTILLGAQDGYLNEDSVNPGNYINSETKDPHDKESSHNNSEERYENDDETEKYENDAKTSPVHEIIHEAAASVRELNQDESLHHENCCRMCRRENRLLLQKVEALNQMVKEAIELLKEQRSSGGEKH
ncbi:hypothetical protein QAD02_008815 [Eretmocerus hayati]|uniref:Uncharacterized protein n=1 Tax=Eretmocerus hayati TaxID=131215 RepID=A0ACC2N868_9HYME|nr:hypothetical protein QAD02_008815 [Eretmocerus hayati]